MERITDISQLDPNGTYTYGDYLKWQFDETVELLRGKISRMSPAPKKRHQTFATRLSRYLVVYFYPTSCQLFYAPFDVRLPNPQYPETSKKVHTVVQPDLCVVCDEAKLDENGCQGAPDWIIEITSPGTIKKDFGEKFSLYEESGVKEYWIAVPEAKTVHQYVLRGERFALERLYENSDDEESPILQPTLFSDLLVDIREVFSGL